MRNYRNLKTLAGPLLLALTLSGLVTVGLAGCEDANGKTPEKVVAAGAPVSAALVIEKPITETQEFSGRMEAVEHVKIQAHVGGFITAVNVKPGGAVKKGDVLFVIDARLFKAEADRAEAAAAAARAKADLAKIELSRAQKLFAEKAIAQRELDENVSGYKELAANARAAEAQNETARLNLAYTQVTSPIDGRVSKAEITLGNLIDPGTVLTTVVSDDHIYVGFDGDEDTYLRVGAAAHTGRPVNVNVGLANETGFPHQGKLEFVDNQLDPQTGAVRMRAVFANTEKVLVPGLFARVQLQGGNGANGQTRALLINERAVGTDQSRKFVYIVNADDKAEYRLVTLGPTIDGYRVVRSGLTVGEKIVVNGLQRVRPGALLAPHIVTMDFDPDAAALQARLGLHPAPAAETKVATAATPVQE